MASRRLVTVDDQEFLRLRDLVCDYRMDDTDLPSRNAASGESSPTTVSISSPLVHVLVADSVTSKLRDVLCIDRVSGRDTQLCKCDDLYRYRQETIVTFINQSSGEYLVYVAVLRDCWYVQRGSENVHYQMRLRWC